MALALDNSGNLTQGTGFSSAVISGSGGLVVSAGSVTLNQLNAYTGGTVVNGGTLALATNNTTGCIRGNLTVNAGGTVNLLLANATGYGGTTGVINTAYINYGQIINSSGGNEGQDTSFNLTGGTMSSTGGDYTFNLAGVSITSNSTNVSSVVSARSTCRATA